MCYCPIQVTGHHFSHKVEIFLIVILGWLWLGGLGKLLTLARMGGLIHSLSAVSCFYTINVQPQEEKVLIMATALKNRLLFTVCQVKSKIRLAVSLCAALSCVYYISIILQKSTT